MHIYIQKCILGDIILIFQVRHGHQTFVSKWEVDVTTLETTHMEESLCTTWRCAAVTPTCKIFISMKDNYLYM